MGFFTINYIPLYPLIFLLLRVRNYRPTNSRFILLIRTRSGYAKAVSTDIDSTGATGCGRMMLRPYGRMWLGYKNMQIRLRIRTVHRTISDDSTYSGIYCSENFN